jgi:chitinase
MSMAVNAAGGRPINSWVWGDNLPDIYQFGGLWWGGNLKGLVYNLMAKDAETG